MKVKDLIYIIARFIALFVQGTIIFLCWNYVFSFSPLSWSQAIALRFMISQFIVPKDIYRLEQELQNEIEVKKEIESQEIESEVNEKAQVLVDYLMKKSK